LYFAHVSLFGSGVENDSEVGADSGEWDIKNCFFAAGFSAVGRPDRNINLYVSWASEMGRGDVQSHSEDRSEDGAVLCSKGSSSNGSIS
jgi:hypothetical protein